MTLPVVVLLLEYPAFSTHLPGSSQSNELSNACRKIFALTAAHEEPEVTQGVSEG
jgi:hypothetical protein